MKYPAPTRKDHESFCVTEGWEKRKSARGKTGDHHRYELQLSDGDILYTRISHPINARETYGDQLWGHILKDQLCVTSDEFWACARDGVTPDRGGEQSQPVEAIPLGVVQALISLGVPESEVHEMSRDQAIQRLNDFYSK